MANTIRIKRRSAASGIGAPSSLANAELAFNEASNILYYGTGTGGAGGSATQVIAIAGEGAFSTIATSQTLTNKTIGSGSVWNGGVISATYGGTGVNNGSYTITLGGNISTAGSFTTSGAYGVTFVATNTTNVTLPTSGTLATLAGSENLTNKTIGSGSTWNGNTIGIAYGGTGTTNGSITGTGALTFTAGGTNTSINLVPNGTGTVDVSSKRITNVADPTQAQDAATKAYVDAVKTGLAVKDPARAASTTNLNATYNNGTSGVGATLTNAGTQIAFALDGVTLNAGERVLIKDQTSGLQNGVYVVTTTGSGSTNWVLTRAGDFDNSPNGEVLGGAFVFVQEGSTQADNGYVVTTNGSITIGTTSIDWAQFSGAGQITAGAGLTKTGNTIDVVGTSNRITVNADSIDIASTYVGQSSITTLGTITTGAWQGNVISPTYGGTGVNNGSYTISLGGNVSTAGALTLSGAFGTTFTITGTTSLTLPTSGTLATLAGSETLTNKTLGSGSTWNGNTVDASYGGTGQSSYAIGDILYASASNALSKLAAVATGNVLISGGVSTAPSWGKVGLTTHVSGTLAVGNGGTGITTATVNGIIYGNGTNAFGVTSAGTWDSANSVGQLLSVDSSGIPTWTNTIDGGTF